MELSSFVPVGNKLQGQQIYQAKCASCHNPIETSTKIAKNPTNIKWGLENVPNMRNLNLSEAEILAVAEALKVDLEICEAQDRPGHVPSNRLAHNEYVRAVNDLFGLNGNWSSSFTSDNYAGFYDNEAFSKDTDQVLTESYFEASKTITNALFANATAKQSLMICSSSQGATCARSILQKVGRIAFRRPLSTTDLNNIVLPFTKGISLGYNFDDSLKAALRSILINPEFLFKIHKKTNQSIRNLDAFELASRLSFFIWGSLPDDQLLRHAESGQLLQPATLNQEITRLLSHQKSKTLVNSFMWQWLNLNKIYEAGKQPNTNLYPDFTTQLRTDMINETVTFLTKLLEEDKTPLDIVTGRYTYVNERLNNYYSFPGQVTGSSFVRTNLPANRSGILTHGTILTMTSNPDETSIVNRGSWALERLLCLEPPPDAPADVSTEIPNVAGLSLRERLEVHRDKPSCKSCHSVMDPLGFAFENFGATGKFRESWKDGFRVDATGELPDGSRFDGVHELALRISSNGDFQRCMTEQLLSYATARQMGLNDTCTVNRIGKRDISSTSKFSDLVKSVVNSDPFKRYQDQEVK